MGMELPQLDFRLIDFDNNEDLAIRFREESFVVSFGDASAFHETDGRGPERYLEWLKAKHSRDPKSVLHIGSDDKIIWSG